MSITIKATISPRWALTMTITAANQLPLECIVMRRDTNDTSIYSGISSIEDLDNFGTDTPIFYRVKTVTREFTSFADAKSERDSMLEKLETLNHDYGVYINNNEIGVEKTYTY